MLNDKQALILTGILTISFFVFGILDVLNNFVVLTALTIIFFSIIINLFYLNYKPKKDVDKQKEIK
ncbi:hypothetical protein GCM10023311_27990 [Flaviramulus aquimarinus]|uniref:Uncharacterized protein n=1 Tax=Flaviramulus aquimarinus TaxID=1170456 RepID=A0ABP9FEC8_9FLAO